MVLQGSAWHGILNSGAVTYMTGADATVRAAFIGNGNLPNTQDTAYRAISNSWPVFGLSKSLGSITDSTSSPVIFAVGHARSPSIQYMTAGDVLQDRYPYYAATYSTPLAAVSTLYLITKTCTLDQRETNLSFSTALLLPLLCGIHERRQHERSLRHESTD